MEKVSCHTFQTEVGCNTHMFSRDHITIPVGIDRKGRGVFLLDQACGWDSKRVPQLFVLRRTPYPICMEGLRRERNVNFLEVFNISAEEFKWISCL